MNKFDTLANSILESLNEADDVTNVVKGITNKVPTKIIPAADVQKMFPKANITGTNQPPVAPMSTNQPPVAPTAPTAPTSTNQPPRNVGGLTPAYDPAKDPLLKDIPGFKVGPPIAPKLGKIQQDYLKRRQEMDAARDKRFQDYLKRRKEMEKK
tara:strand:+ start:82 stop:543 length:462 start_codon:yes stop_codon:yes gene_type:complete